MLKLLRPAIPRAGLRLIKRDFSWPRLSSTSPSRTTHPNTYRTQARTGNVNASEIMGDVESDPLPGNATSITDETGKDAATLPKLSIKEFQVYNHMAEHMDMFHENFRRSWNMLSTACNSRKRPQGMSVRQFLGTAEQFCHHLTMHHTIEEQHIFPVLARKMPAFQHELELLSQHKEIHRGLDVLEEYVRACRTGERELRLEEMGQILDGFGAVLWQHLDDEVKQLGAENMRKFWSLDEMRRMPM